MKYCHIILIIMSLIKSIFTKFLALSAFWLLLTFFKFYFVIIKSSHYYSSIINQQMIIICEILFKMFEKTRSQVSTPPFCFQPPAFTSKWRNLYLSPTSHLQTFLKFIHSFQIKFNLLHLISLAWTMVYNIFHNF